MAEAAARPGAAGPGAHPHDDVLVDLALGTVPGAEREIVRDHLDVCAACRAAYAEVVESVGAVLLAAPRAAPPPGFAAATARAMAAGDGVVAGESHAPGEGRGRGRPEAARGSPRRARRWVPVAAALLLGVALGAGAAAVVLPAADPEPPAGSAAPVAAPTPLLDASGRQVGTVLGTRAGAVGAGDVAEDLLVVAITGGRPGVRYDCALVLADGTRREAGSWVRADGAASAWVVPVPTGAEVTTVELTTPTGRLWATAEL